MVRTFHSYQWFKKHSYSSIHECMFYTGNMDDYLVSITYGATFRARVNGMSIRRQQLP